jgi:Dopey, N-terminal
MSGLCACLNDSVILVQRNTLEFLLLGFPLHSTLLAQNDLIKLVTNSLSTILRRDMSLNRRVYSWLLGSEIQNTNRKKLDGEDNGSLSSETSSLKSTNVTYFEQNSKHILIKALRIALKTSVSTADLRPYKILMSLLDKVEIGPVVLDFILIDVIRTVTLVENSIDVKKSLNALFGNFDPSFIWNFLTNQFESACLRKDTPRELRILPENLSTRKANEVDSGAPSVIEICFLTESLLEILSLEIFNDTTRVFLPRVLFAITKIITLYANSLTDDEVTASILLSTKIIKHIQPMIL